MTMRTDRSDFSKLEFPTSFEPGYILKHTHTRISCYTQNRDVAQRYCLLTMHKVQLLATSNNTTLPSQFLWAVDLSLTARFCMYLTELHSPLSLYATRSLLPASPGTKLTDVSLSQNILGMRPQARTQGSKSLPVCALSLNITPPQPSWGVTSTP